jgi:hypothetical protein
MEEVRLGRRQYRLRGLQKFQYLALAAVFLVGTGFFLKLAADPIGRDFVLVVGLAFLIPGLALISLALRSRLTLDESRIEVRSALRTFTANRNDIEGLRAISNQYGRWTRIYLKGDSGAFNVSDSFSGNDELNEWLKGLPDLDERDAAEITQQVSSQESPGGAGDEQLTAFKQAKTWAIALSIVAGVASIPVMFVDYAPIHTASLVLLLLLPPLGVFLVHYSPLLFTIFKRGVDPRADLGVIAVLPGIAILVSYKTAADPTHLVEIFQLIYWVLVVLVCYVGALFRVAWENPSRWGALVGLLIFGGMYSVGMVNTANTVPDRSVPQNYRTRVLKMYETHGRSASSYLRLAPWGPLGYYDDVDVPKSIYEQVKVGDEICVGLHPGFLHSPWYVLQPCPEQLRTNAPQFQ